VDTYDEHYEALFRPVVERVGPLDPETLTSIVGFDAGGPVSMCTVGLGRAAFPTFVTCELSVREDQKTGASDPFDLLITCNDEDFARRTLTAIGDLSLSSSLGHGHTVSLDEDLGENGIDGVLLEEFAKVTIAGESFCLLRVLGVDARTLRLARRRGVAAAVTELKDIGSYPKTLIER
jgi:hypothetical protein